MANSPEAVAAYKYLYNRTVLDTMQNGLELEKKSEFTIRDTESRIETFRKKKPK